MAKKTNVRAAKAKAGRQRLAEEAARVDAIKAGSSRPDGCGSEIVDIAPARGAVQKFQPKTVQVTNDGNVAVRRSGHDGQDALRIADAFDRMQVQALRRNKNAKPQFTAGQISAGRDYAALYERVQSAGVKCASLDGTGGAGGPGSYIDAVMRDRQRLEELQRRIGHDLVLVPRRARPSPHATRRPVKVSDVVREICVAGRTVSELLQKFGWSRNTTSANKIRSALQDALDRMQGFS